MADRLYRSRDDRMLAGVAAGVADTLDLDPSLVRIVWALLTIFTGGIAFVVYIVMAIVVPERPAWDQPGTGPWTPPPGPPIVPSAPSTPTDAAPAEAAGTAVTPGTAEAPGTTMPGAPIGPAQAPPPPSYWATDREARRAARRARRAGEPGRGGLIFGVILIVIGAAFLVREVVPWFDWRLWWPIGLIGLGGLLLALALLPGRNSD